MAPYDDWNKVEDEDDEELEDYSVNTNTFGNVFGA